MRNQYSNTVFSTSPDFFDPSLLDLSAVCCADHRRSGQECRDLPEEEAGYVEISPAETPPERSGVPFGDGLSAKNNTKCIDENKKKHNEM